ncbi:hypothetical protein J0A67_08095 [Algoriphagus aestuariicola]|uniref:DUF4760 domain-containing protein n=1 Tax=Algoriphagus aestuariicola TaxID=1852016 RepID=A0ABS3BNC5_9BACT|nr:hypothetical protein [Algoriphagus aestuariicola]MBN7800817.1 hypothetical protein [Algoriphagus aestuariicola]
MNIFELIFEQYWDQLLILIGLAFIAIKYILENKRRKNEIIEEIFRAGKIKAINEFLEQYADQSAFWLEIPYYDIIEGKFRGKEVDEIVRPGLNKLEKSFYRLSIYLNDSEYNDYITLVENIRKINRRLSESYRNFNFFNKKDISQTNEFYYVQSDMLKENELILREIVRCFRTNFKK